jgi:cytochrome c5
MMRQVLIVMTACIAITACAPKKSPQVEHSRALAQASTVAPVDKRLSVLYKQSCKTCHAIENSGAPLVQDRSLWDARWEKGLSTLLQSTVTGLNGMPPGGQCFACTAADYEALIKFMAGRP